MSLGDLDREMRRLKKENAKLRAELDSSQTAWTRIRDALSDLLTPPEQPVSDDKLRELIEAKERLDSGILYLSTVAGHGTAPNGRCLECELLAHLKGEVVVDLSPEHTYIQTLRKQIDGYKAEISKLNHGLDVANEMAQSIIRAIASQQGE